VSRNSGIVHVDVSLFHGYILDEFCMYLHYVRSLKFDDKPDYDFLRKLFRDLFTRQGYRYDYMFDWAKSKVSSSTIIFILQSIIIIFF
jgi:hypothetical protein